MKIDVYRDFYTADTTLGKLFIDGDFFCYTLEDAVRPIKIPGKTAIPEGTYSVIVTRSPRFRRDMPLIYNYVNEAGLQMVVDDKMSFKGIRIHGGNTHNSTEGCLIVAYNRDLQKATVWKTAEHDLTARLKLYDGNITLKIKNLVQDNKNVK